MYGAKSQLFGCILPAFVQARIRLLPKMMWNWWETY